MSALHPDNVAPQNGHCAIMTIESKLTSAQRDSLIKIGDILVICLALVLPWSTSATVISICLGFLSSFRPLSRRNSCGK
jgi:hypothetical protein